MRESSTTSNDFLPHASLSLDYGSDSPVSVCECVCVCSVSVWVCEYIVYKYMYQCVCVNFIFLSRSKLAMETINFNSFKNGSFETRRTCFS